MMGILLLENKSFLGGKTTIRTVQVGVEKVHGAFQVHLWLVGQKTISKIILVLIWISHF